MSVTNQHPLYLKISSFAKNYIRIENEIVPVVLEIDTEKLYRDWGYSSLFQLLLSLGLTEHQVYSLTKVSRKCAEIPKLKEAIASQSVSVSKASRIVSVIENNNAISWITKASQLSHHKLQQEIVALSPKAKIKEEIKPIASDLAKLTLSLSSDREKKLRRLQDLYAQKLKRTVTLEETHSYAIELAFAKLDPVMKAQRVQDKLLKRNEKQTSKLAHTATQNSLVKHDTKQSPVQNTIAEVNNPLGPDLVGMATQRHLVNLRDRGLCQYLLPQGTKCLTSRFVDIHHVIPRSQGGTDAAINLITLCKNHHRHTHDLLKQKLKPRLNTVLLEQFAEGS